MSMKEKIAEFIKGRPREAMFDEQGRTICDPKPLKHPVGFRKPPTREQQLQQILRRHQQEMAFNAQYVDETDFNIDRPEFNNDATPDFLTAYEQNNVVFEMEPEVPAQTTSPEPVSGDTDAQSVTGATPPPPG